MRSNSDAVRALKERLKKMDEVVVGSPTDEVNHEMADTTIDDSVDTTSTPVDDTIDDSVDTTSTPVDDTIDDSVDTTSTPVDDTSTPVDNISIQADDTSTPVDNISIQADDTIDELVDTTSIQADDTIDEMVDTTSIQADDTIDELVDTTSTQADDTIDEMVDTTSIQEEEVYSLAEPNNPVEEVNDLEFRTGAVSLSSHNEHIDVFDNLADLSEVEYEDEYNDAYDDEDDDDEDDDEDDESASEDEDSNGFNWLRMLAFAVILIFVLVIVGYLIWTNVYSNDMAPGDQPQYIGTIISKIMHNISV